MRLFEYQAKELFENYDIQVPRSVLAKDGEEALAAFKKLKHPVVLKAQVLAGGRGKAGGIKVVSTETDVLSESSRIMEMTIGGERPSALLVEESFPHDQELYLSITLDRGERSFVAIASLSGGVEVESLAGKVVEKIELEGLEDSTAESIGDKLGLQGPTRRAFIDLLKKLERLAREEECELAEINPVAIGTEGEMKCLDAKIILDDNALFRHPEFSKLHPEDELEGEASRQGFAFVRLDGDIAIVGNGAGLVLSTLDLVANAGGAPACFLDLGGGAQKDRVEAAVTLVNRLPNARSILVNIFGGITRTTDVAEGLKAVMGRERVKPVYARISGAEETEARKILAGTSAKLYQTAPEAVKAVVSRA